MRDESLPRIAISLGDPAGIGPEIGLKAALDSGIRRICRPVLVGDRSAIETHARACGLDLDLRIIADVGEARWDDGGLNLLECRIPGDAALELGTVNPVYGRAALDSARRAIAAALAREVDAVVAAPQTESSIALAGIAFDGYPSFVARETGMDPHDVFLMHWFDDVRI